MLQAAIRPHVAGTPCMASRWSADSSNTICSMGLAGKSSAALLAPPLTAKGVPPAPLKVPSWDASCAPQYAQPAAAQDQRTP